MADLESELQEGITKILNSYGELIVDNIKQQISNAGKIATGNLINSIGFQIVVNEQQVSLEILAADYFQWVDQGRRPGGKQPPIQPLIQWISVKGLTPPQRRSRTGRFTKGTTVQRQTSLACAIAKSIQRNGIKGVNLFRQLESIEQKMTNEIGIVVENTLLRTMFEDLQQEFNGIKIT